MEIIANAIQLVPAGQNVVFTDTVVEGCDIISHRPGSGLIKVHAIPGKCYTRFRVTFGANIAIPVGQSVGPINLAITLDGEPVASTQMILTPAAADAYGNVFSSVYVYVRKGCCSTIGVENTSTIPINVQNANLIVTLG